MNNMPRFIGITQLYGEPGVAFILGEKFAERTINLIPPALSGQWGNHLNAALERKGVFLKRNKDYSLELVITATKKNDALEVRGPSISRRQKNIHFAIWIPYNPVMAAADPLKKITEFFREGVRNALTKLEYPEEDIKKAVEGIYSPA